MRRVTYPKIIKLRGISSVPFWQIYHMVNCFNWKPESHSGWKDSGSLVWSSQHSFKHQLANYSQLKLCVTVLWMFFPSASCMCFLNNSQMFSDMTLICLPSLGTYEPSFQTKSISLYFQICSFLGLSEASLTKMKRHIFYVSSFLSA